MGRLAARPSQKTGVRASRFPPRRGLVAACGAVHANGAAEEACFRPRLGQGAANKGEEGGGGRRLRSLPVRSAQEEEDNKNYLLC